MYNEDAKRLSSQGESRKTPDNDLLDEATIVARDVLKSIQALAGTTNCKGVQIARLKDWAIKNHYWIDDISELGIFSDRGSENEVYLSYNDEHILYKLNDFRYADDNLTPFFERIVAHNYYFPDCRYSLIAFANNKDGKTCAVLQQQFVLSEREATDKEIYDELERLGFHAEDNGEYFTNGVHDIFDAVPNNVLMGKDGHLYFIDTIIFLSGTGGENTYRSLSPRANH